MVKFGCPSRFIATQGCDNFMMAYRHVCKMMESSLNPFEVSNGVEQGCVMAPTLFSMMFSVMLMDAFEDSGTGFLIRYRFDGYLINLRKVQVGKDQEKAQSEKDSHSKNRGGKKTN